MNYPAEIIATRPSLTSEDYQARARFLEAYRDAGAVYCGKNHFSVIDAHRHKEAPKPQRRSHTFKTTSLGDMETAIRGWQHTNVYFLPALVRHDLPAGQAPKESDIVAMRALLMDGDTDHGLPITLIAGIEPTILVETSRSDGTQNLQPHYVFDRPISVAEFKELAELAYRKCGGDPCCKNADQLYRVPGTLNHPGYKKIADYGRSPEPQPVRVIGGSWKRIRVADLRAALKAMPDRPEAARARAVEVGAAVHTTATAGATAALLQRIQAENPRLFQLMREEHKPGDPKRDRSTHCGHVMKCLFEMGLTIEEVAAVAVGAPFAIKFAGRVDQRVKREHEIWSEAQQMKAKAAENWKRIASKASNVVQHPAAGGNHFDGSAARKLDEEPEDEAVEEALEAAEAVEEGAQSEKKKSKKEERARARERLQQRQNSPDWCNWPDVSNEGKVKARSQINIAYFLKRQGISLSFDLFAHRTLVTRNGKTETLTDEVAKGLWLDADRRGLQAKDAYFFAVLENTARQSSFHPIRDYLDGLKWDGVSRLDKWLSSYFGAEDTKLNSAYGRKHLIAAVRRARQPGVKHDPILILQGKQGGEKSTGISALCPDAEYFSDNLTVGADQKEVIEQTSGKWLVEIPELDGMGKRDASATKAMLSRQVDEARLAYGRTRSVRPRQCVFFGTVNEHHYLLDATGNRRFWPVSVGVADVDAIKRDRDQLWAEAAHYEALGESSVLPKELWAAAADSQNERMMVDPWIETHSNIILALDDDGFIKSEDIYRVLGIPTERRAGAQGKRVASVMGALGYTRIQKREAGKQVWGYKRG